jgi:hypothetical protein
MHLDSQGLVVLDQDTFPGNIGDSCAETSRLVTLNSLNNEFPWTQLSAFITDKGILRYPTSPWREDDTSSDQVAPLIAACSLTQPQLTNIVIAKIVSAGYKTGNGNIISPGLLTNMKRHQKSCWQSFWDLAILGQALLFKVPVRWSDSKKWFEPSSGSSADYLNFINGLAFAKQRNWTWVCSLCVKLVSADTALAAVQSYYKPEPNNSIILDAYAKSIQKIWR